MYVFSSVVYHTGLCTSGCFVFILLYVQVLSVDSTSENSTIRGKQVKSTDQPFSKADSQIPKSEKKCCFSEEWLLYSSSDKNFYCVELPRNIKNISLKSSWFGTFSKFGIVTKSFCRGSDQTEVWTKSNATYYRYYSENKTVFNLVTKKYYYVACNDYINFNAHYSEKINYENNENFKKLENEISQFFLCNIPEEDLKEKIRNFLYSYGMGVSNFFSAITFYLYIITPKLRRKVYDKCFLCQLATFIVAVSFTIWRQQLSKEDEPGTFCTFVGE